MNTTSSPVGVHVNATWFDVADIIDVPNCWKRGSPLQIVSYAIPPGYGGQLVYFAQYADYQPAQPTAACSAIMTPGYEWSIRMNGLPMAPYRVLTAVVNPWGMVGIPLDIPLQDEAELSLSITWVGNQNGKPEPAKLMHVGGRLLGRIWTNG